MNATSQALTYTGANAIVIVGAGCLALLLIAWAVIRPPGRYRARVIQHAGGVSFMIFDLIENRWTLGQDGRMLEFENWLDARAHTKALNEGREQCL